MASAKCWRVPACVSGAVILIWISVVPVTSLGCLLGRDFLDAIGTCKSLTGMHLHQCWQRLDQLSAGHFMLPLLSIRWPRLDVGSWRTCGLDKIIELKLDPSDWLKRRISEGVSGHPVPDAASHEHNLTESGFFSSEVATRLHSTNLTEHEHVDLAQKMNASLKQQPVQHPPRRRSLLFVQMTSPSTRQELLPFLQAAGQSDWPPLMTLSRGAQETLLSNGVCAIPLEKIYSQASWTPAVVRRKFEALAGFSLLLALLALFISFSIHCSWMLQGQTMVSQQVLPASHH